MTRVYRIPGYLLLLMSLNVQTYAQNVNEFSIIGGQLEGEQVQGTSLQLRNELKGEYHHLYYTKKQLVASWSSELNENEVREAFVVNAPFEVEIVSANFKSDYKDVLVVLFSDGTVTMYGYNGLSWKELISQKIISQSSYPYYRKIVGDALYVHEGGTIYASWDSAKTWSIDTTGLNGAYVIDIAVDTNNYGWVATTNGVFYQHPDSNIWRASASPLGYSQSIYVDRKNRILVSSAGKTYVSSNNGTIWQDITDNLPGGATSYGDDAKGNIYAIVSGGEVYRLSNLTPPWVKISDPLKALGAAPAADQFNPLVNSIHGDSVLSAATKYGLYESTDAGATWQKSTIQFPAFQFYGLVRSGKYYLVSTDLGIYRLKDGDTTFTKVFPPNGFHSDLKIKTDSAGNIYTVFPVQEGELITDYYNFKSTNNGTTWFPDTGGKKIYFLQYADYDVDAQGNQYAFKGGYGFFSKAPGGMWKIDTNGLGLDFGGSINRFSNNNKKGFVYVVREFGFQKFALYRRALNGTTWEQVDATPVGQANVNIISDNNGDIILKTYDTGKIFRYNGTTWTGIPTATGIGGSPLADQYIVDKNGVLWVSYVDAFTYFPLSVCFTTDNGITWKKVAMDGIGVSFFATAGDSVFAVSWIDGVFALTVSSSLRVEEKNSQIIESFKLYQNYPNPFNPTTSIQYSIASSQKVTLKIFDLLGREVATLVNQEQEPGSHTVQFDASKLSSGIYIYNLKAGNFTASKKLLLMK